jgi:glycosyltransferase involved in cell wall biosynthesis
MTIHLISLPHVQVSEAYCRDAYLMKILHFCRMMDKEGVKVILYASEDNETPAELVTCITKKQQAKLGFNGPDDYLKNTFDRDGILYKLFHQRVIYEMGKRIKKGDIIGSFMGTEDVVAKAFPDNRWIELGIGYSGVRSDYRVYESYAWMHTVIGAATMGKAEEANGFNYHVVIPNYFDPKDFPFVEKKKDYLLYVGRMIHRKGIKIIEEMARRMPDTKFILAGQGAKQEGNKIICQELTMAGDNLEYIGMLDIKKRGKLMSEAKALIVPTLYIGPFEGVQVEANFCGTPTITSNFGCFTENNIEGLTGYRCSTIKQFIEACGRVDALSPKKIRDYAISKFSMDVVAKQYIKYFEQIKGLDYGGFYEA